jgi:hypothetical protein
MLNAELCRAIIAFLINFNMHNDNDATYSEAIEKVMMDNGYFASLKLLYKNIWKYKDKTNIVGKTPDYTIQERVQRDKRFTRIGLGVYALTDYLDKLPAIIAPKNEVEKINRKHAEMQGMLLEIGNFKKEVEDTYTNDKKWIFQNKTLGSLATLDAVPFFTYEKILKESVSFADVIWFNERGFPYKIFEVEHSTDFRDALIKFMELQDFIIEFYCVSSEDRRIKFEREKGKTAFKPIGNRLKFLTYEQVENDYQSILKKLIFNF